MSDTSKEPPKFPDDIFTVFYDHGTDRSEAVALPVILEQFVEFLLREAMTPHDKAAVNEVLSPSGPIGSFGAKCRLAYVLGLMHQTTYQDFMLITKIRNRFAHELQVKEYSDPVIDNWMRSLHMYKIMQEISVEDLDRNSSDFDHWLRFCMQEELKSGRSTYRTIIRLYCLQMQDLLTRRSRAKKATPAEKTEKP
jgi:DNA-binding MltR family transcriptional regulator